MSRIVVCDTGPLLHLCEAGAIHLLKAAGTIVVPPIVADEFKKYALAQTWPDWVDIRRLNALSNTKVSEWIREVEIDIGEAEAIGLAMQEPCDWFLTDDAQARQFAESLGLEVHGSVGLLLWAVAAGHIKQRQEANQLIYQLNRSSLWISKRVITEAIQAIEEMLDE